MYTKRYSSCVFCKKDIILCRIKVHESLCLEQQRLKDIPKGKPGKQKGSSAWNKGLNKGIDERVKKNSESLSKTIQKQIADGSRFFYPMSITARKTLSERQSLNNTGGRCKWFEVSGVKVQGTWERDIALCFNNNNVIWQKMKLNVDIWKYLDKSNKTRSYTPDFYLPEYDIFLEVKGYWWGDDKEKMKLVLSQHKDKTLIIIETTDYYKITKDNDLSCLVSKSGDCRELKIP